jgi:hypothetical protein
MGIHDSISTFAGSGGKLPLLRLNLAADRAGRCLIHIFFM